MMKKLFVKLYWRVLYPFLYKRFPQFAMMNGMATCVIQAHRCGVLVERPPFMFGILIDGKSSLPIVILDTPLGFMDAHEMETLDAWWNEEARDLVQPIVDKINLLTQGNK